MSLKVITPPAVEPLSLEEAKRNLRIDSDDLDADIVSLIKQSREYCEDYQKKKYISQTLELILDSFPDEIEFLECSPVQSVTSIKYTDKDGNEKTVASTDYILDSDSFVNRLVPAYDKRWPTAELQPINAVRIRFVAGYGDDSSTVPESVKWAMITHIQTLFDTCQPNEKEKLERTRDRLLGMRRVISV